MVGKKERTHYKVQAMTQEEQDEINKKLLEGMTYAALSAWLDSRGYSISKSALHRYGQTFLAKYEAIKQARDQARAIVEDNPGAPATQLAEASNEMALQLIMEELMNIESLEGEEPVQLMKALALLQKSSAQIQRVKMDYQKKIEKAARNIEEKLEKKKGLDPETLRVIREEIYGIV
ncbi:MAG: hypothetical protein A2Y38_01625 [Spirochaetes bacterium GWB1_59_5]|nr:MAG: hypothetical protein A2Y38_01625 [Spirochaetes bacterium GWB1_59_5]